MGITERKQRTRDDTRQNILKAAMNIVTQEGWPALSMRKIAEAIEYAVPIIYEHFHNKEALIIELTRNGFRELIAHVNAATVKQRPLDNIKAMWLAYWDFAFSYKQYYQIMFGVEMPCCIDKTSNIPEQEKLARLFKDAIKAILHANATEDEVTAKYYTYWSVVHGLVAINLVSKSSSDTVNRHILIDAIDSINVSIVL